ncbi:hypothetical protein DET49_1124 [Salegentibacter sp. 24]|uniref:hypothetical protein n=1 Tax=Salegentibacter sp. 24 TaxID=2183986 RepID=UPI001060159C|nr:hypothetical protein [Salegentibacter sp. 24]TDN87315.1 hypothetical protein DET49_1124 [Salegentibacter sp. 24]
MNNNSIYQITQAIKNFDIKTLDEILDDDISYMDVTKSLFLKKLKKKFKNARKDGCHFFDDVFFGICGSCNIGCEGVTFLSKSGYYIDLFIESKDDKTVSDICICNKLNNFADLDKKIDLGFSFCKDEKVTFKASTEYTLIEQHLNTMLSDLSDFKIKIFLDDLIEWYDKFNYLRSVIDQLGPFECFDYKLYSKAFGLTNQINNIYNLKSKTEYAADALITYHQTTSEREKLIWFLENRKDHNGTINFQFPREWRKDLCVIYKINNIKLTIDFSGYEYVLDYFIKLDNFYDELMEKYKPLPEHFDESETGYIECSLENHLILHHKHLDVVEMYRRKHKP